MRWDMMLALSLIVFGIALGIPVTFTVVWISIDQWRSRQRTAMESKSRIKQLSRYLGTPYQPTGEELLGLGVIIGAIAATVLHWSLGCR